ncbi:cupin domain-containing protein [Burkholderia sp. WSM2232]|uniref:cupin domain-containing protein n=1 Tax=Burkholderia sp. WSM2232 TaxID=944436 RepID=UPI000486B764|nr:cupin domain-containing protein [Burkholderia sp. WSM2232]
MSITLIKQSAHAVLELSGPVPVPLSDPACQTASLDVAIPGREHVEAGIWECEPGKSKRTVEKAEIVHILAGEASFTSEEGQVVNMRAGDTLFFPPMTKGYWEIRSKIRKVFVIV